MLEAKTKTNNLRKSVTKTKNVFQVLYLSLVLVLLTA